MSDKNLDDAGRWCSKTVAFRVSPEEAGLIDAQVAMSGLTKQDYITKRLLARDVVVMPSSRVQARLQHLCDEANDNLCCVVETERIGNGLVEQLGEFADGHDDLKVVIIDTFQTVRTPSNQTIYSADYEDMGALKAFADERGIALLAIHHTRKMGNGDVFNTISGSNGLMGRADETMVLRRKARGSSAATLNITGRDVKDQKFSVRFVDCRWELVEKVSDEELEARAVPAVVVQHRLRPPCGSRRRRAGERPEQVPQRALGLHGVAGRLLVAREDRRRKAHLPRAEGDEGRWGRWIGYIGFHRSLSTLMRKPYGMEKSGLASSPYGIHIAFRRFDAYGKPASRARTWTRSRCGLTVAGRRRCLRGQPPLPIANLRGKETLMENHRNFDKDIHVRLKEEHLREFDEVSRRLGITKSELVRLLVQLPTSIVKEGNIRCVYIDQTALRGCFREMKRWVVNLNQAIHALNKIPYELGYGKASEPARVLQDIKAATIAANACIDAVDEAQKLFESFEGHHPYLVGRRRSDVKRGRSRKKKDDELPSDYNERRAFKGNKSSESWQLSFDRISSECNWH